MEYRKLPKGTEEISVIGFGGSGIHEAGEKEGVETIRVFEAANEESEGMLSIPALGITKKISLKPFELKTLHLDEKAGVIADADLFD